MFEKLNKLRTEHEKAKARFEEAKAKYEEAEEKLNAELAASILDVVGRKDFTPEQLAEHLGVGDKEKPASKSKKKETKTADVKEEPLPFSDDNDAHDTENEEIMEDILNESY
ncbi:DUF4315 family protein [Butyrivibrio sp. WCD3002]|uniref:DUF4315 family protein n=1 Tax=Butyrivibrio sp. WCD3002 TaxID=1280676 RepID=UPI0004121F4B|nr:DUF4315 family protein [Butyrivibrio sp. WCD3002]